MIRWHSCVKSFPKFERHTIGAETAEIISSFMHKMAVSNGRPISKKLSLIAELDRQLKLLRICFLMAFDLKTVNKTQYTNLDESAKELGRMLGGWRNQLLEKIKAGEETASPA